MKMSRANRKLVALCAGFMALSLASVAYAIPSLQLGPGTGSWTYDTSTQTWVTDDNPFNLLATANATKEDGGNGDFAWDSMGANSRKAYLVASAVPKTADNDDVFDITVQNDGGILGIADAGFGTPPISDPNSIAPHGIFDTYFEIYQFNFDGALTDISDTQPGKTGTGKGYKEFFDIKINSVDENVESIHFDLFTMVNKGNLNDEIVKAFAPFSHDAENVPEASSTLLLGIGLLALGLGGRKKMVSRG